MLRFKATPKLKEIRKEKFTQAELVDLISMQTGETFLRNTYAQKEAGWINFSADEANAVSRALGIKVSDVFEVVSENKEEGGESDNATTG